VFGAAIARARILMDQTVCHVSIASTSTGVPFSRYGLYSHFFTESDAASPSRGEREAITSRS